jgi:ubiquinone biosynthesis protein COQ4
MGSVAPLAGPPSAPRRLQRHWGEGLGNLFRFLRGTGGLESAFDAMFALAGPTVEREFDRFARHPLGLRLLAERPRRDLNALLADREQLQAMPADSFAAAYLEYMGGAGMGTSDYFLAAANLEEKAARFGWTKDQCWFVRRMANSHDLFHVVSGYDRTILGEVGVDAFTAGQIPLVPLKLLLAYLFLLKPSEPLGWTQFVWRSYQHGRRTPSLACVDYEDLLGQPLSQVRHAIGMTPIEDVHPNGFPTRGRKLQQMERGLNYPEDLETTNSTG